MPQSFDTFGDPASASVGVVILNWNNGDDSVECLSSLLAADPRPECVVVVDNGSADESLSQIEAWKTSHDAEAGNEWLTIIPARANLGFAGGTNVGIRHLLSKTAVTHVLLLNNDAYVASSFFCDLQQALHQVPGVGVLGPTIFESPDTFRVWYAGGTEIPHRALVKHSQTVPASSEPRPTDFVTGCAMVLSRDVLTTVGMLAECYFPAYFEDGDYCHRAMDAGYPVVYAPRPSVYHKVGSTVRTANIERELIYHKNRLRVIYARRNYSGVTKAIALTYLALTKPVRTILELLKGNPAHGMAILRGSAAGFAARNVQQRNA